MMKWRRAAETCGVGRLGTLHTLAMPHARRTQHERVRGANVRVRVGERGHGGLKDEHAGLGQVGGVPDLAAVHGEDVGDDVHDELVRIHAELERGRHLCPQCVSLLAAGHHKS